MKSFSIHTLGCKVNQYEEEMMRRILLASGLEETPPGKADLCIINTCSVTAEADRKSRQMIRRALRTGPGTMVVAAGCAVENEQALSPDIPPGVTRLRVGEKERLAEKLGLSRGETILRQGRTRALLKVQDGCSQFCSYCIVPLLRGREKSRPPGEVLEEAAQLSELGHREIVITGIHLGAYGRDLKPQSSLAELLNLLLAEIPLARFRLSSIEPQDFDPAILSLMARDRRLCPHLHLPLQHASPRILSAMRRKYSAEEYHDKAALAVSMVPGIALTTDIMVGFPSESPADFSLLRETVERIPFSRLHVFKYSARPGTKASLLPDDVKPDEKERRSRLMIELGDEKNLSFQKTFISRKIEVLIESIRHRNILEGISENYLPVRLNGPASLAGSLVRVEVTDAAGGILRGVIPGS